MSQLTISTQEKRFPVAPDLYGLFFEDISHAGDGGLYPEMLRNRSFEDSLLPDGCITNDNGKTFTSPTGWIDEFNNGEGMNDWIASQKIAPTTIPAWYSENADMQLNKDNTLNDNRRVSLQVDFEENGKIYNVGYNGINQEKGDTYNFYLFAKSEQTLHLTVSIQINNQTSCSSDIIINDANWKRYDAQFLATETARNATFSIQCQEKGTLYLGFCSLMPAETFHGHGLRKDLAEKLEQMHPSFLRFPGGCIVEGFTLETAMFFCNTVGPVWERPSHWLLWHYRTTNGLGFHEYLQLCEDLKLSALYVCNCGMTCQGRGPYYFNEAQMQFAINDTLNALEYALGSSQTHWGSLRAKMGHPEPFSLKYIAYGQYHPVKRICGGRINHDSRRNLRILFGKNHLCDGGDHCNGQSDQSEPAGTINANLLFLVAFVRLSRSAKNRETKRSQGKMISGERPIPYRAKDDPHYSFKYGIRGIYDKRNESKSGGTKSVIMDKFFCKRILVRDA